LFKIIFILKFYILPQIFNLSINQNERTMSKSTLSDVLKIGLLVGIIYIQTLSTCSNRSIKDLLTDTRQDVKNTGIQVKATIENLDSAGKQLKETIAELEAIKETNKKTRKLIEGIDKKYLVSKLDAQAKLKEIYANLDHDFKVTDTHD
jgi:hypothetical protein